MGTSCIVMALLWSLLPMQTQAEGAGEGPVAIVLIEGQVTDAIGGGLAGAEVTVHRKSADGNKGELVGSTQTDMVGDFKITTTQEIEGEFVVTLSKAQFADSVHRVKIKKGDDPFFLGEALRGNLSVSGKVVNALGKTPVSGARVQLKSMAAELEGVTDKEGHFRVGGVSPGSIELIIEAERFGRHRQVIQKIESFHEPEIILKPDRVVNIKVLDESGRPIANASVECLDQPRTDFRSAITDAEGMVSFSGLHFDAAKLGARLSHPDYVSGAGFDRSITTPPDARESTHEFTMIRAGTITGRVRSASADLGLQGARILVGDEYSDTSPRDWSAHDGTYAIRGVRPGEAVVTVHLADHAPDLKLVSVKGGETTTVDFALGPGAIIEGVVVDDKGAAVTGAEVIATHWRSRSTLGLRAMTDESGRFRIENAPADPFEVIVAVAQRTSMTQTVQAGTRDLRITVPSAAPVPTRSGPLPVGESIPALTMRTLDGQSIATDDWKGKYVLLDFWASWCLPCIEEYGHFFTVHERYGERTDFAIVGISRDHDVSSVRDFLAMNPKIKWPQVVGEAAGVDLACDAFGVKGLPEVFLIGPDGKVIANRLRAGAIEMAVDAVLKAKSPP